jgi:hypothetical protein
MGCPLFQGEKNGKGQDPKPVFVPRKRAWRTIQAACFKSITYPFCRMTRRFARRKVSSGSNANPPNASRAYLK